MGHLPAWLMREMDREVLKVLFLENKLFIKGNVMEIVLIELTLYLLINLM